MDGSYAWDNLVALHTNPIKWAGEGFQLFSSEFENSKNIDTQKTRLERQIKLLQDQEKAVYGKFFADCTTYEDFIKRLRELFDTKHNVDMQIIQNFSAEKIQVLLNKNFGTQIMPSKNLVTEIEIINPDVTKIDISNILKGTSGNFKLSNNIIKLDIRMDDAGIKAMKELLNKAQGKHFHTNSLGTDCMKTYLKHLVVEKKLPEETQKEKIQAITKGFRTTKFIGDSDLRYTLANVKDSSKKAYIRHATNKIKDFFYSPEGLNIASGTQALKKAFQRTWKVNINNIKYGIAFFLKGGTLTYFNGAFGEFQTALLSNYILQRTGAIKDKTLASKISNTIGQTEQAKVDVTLLGNLGIQVKNYNPYTYNYNPIETNTTAKSFLNKLGNMGQEIPADDESQVASLTSFLANYAFSQDYRAMSAGQSTIPSVEEVEQSLANYAGELYNLSISNSEAFSDTVLFYSFSGMYLVPASAILQAVHDHLAEENNRTNIRVSIKWDGDGLSSEDMKKGQGKYNSPYWTKYWHRTVEGLGYQGTEWSRQSAQDTEIKNLLSVTRIQTGFKVTNGFDNNGKIDIAGRLDLSKYKLFN